MRPDELLIAADIHKQLPPDNLRALCAALHPGTRGDCQTCVKPLGAALPVLRVDEVNDFALASLHHTGCRSSAWNSTGKIAYNPGSVTTYSMNKWRISLESDPETSSALIMLNPRLEIARLNRHPVLGWRPAHDPRFAWAGLTPLDPDAEPKPAKGITAFIQDRTLKIRMRDDMTVLPGLGDGYPGGDPQVILDAAQNHVYLFVTHACDPNVIQEDIDKLAVIAHDPGTLSGEIVLR